MSGDKSKLESESEDFSRDEIESYLWYVSLGNF